MSATENPIRLAEATIVEAAGRLADELGPDAVTLTRIADDLGVTQPALYRHVDGLSEMWRLLGVSTRRLLAERLVDATVGRAGPDALRSLAAAWRRFALDHPGRYRTADRHSVVGDPELESAAHHTISVIERALLGFGLDDRRRHFLATTVRSTLHGFCSYELADGHPDRDENDVAFDALVVHLVSAIEVSARRSAS